MSTLRIGWKNTHVVLVIFYCYEETMSKATYKSTYKHTVSEVSQCP